LEELSISAVVTSLAVHEISGLSLTKLPSSSWFDLIAVAWLRKIPKKKREDHYDHHHFLLTKITIFPFAKYRCISGIFGFCLLMCTMIVTNKMNGVTIEIVSFFFIFVSTMKNQLKPNCSGEKVQFLS